jgi:tryptophan synthase alpha chain
VDVPHEESGEIENVLRERGLCRIPLLAPTTPAARAAELVRDARGFVYYITVTGVTGARRDLPEDLAAQLAALRAVSPVPVAAGFGVSSPEQARAVAAHADGVVIGSALVRRIAEAGSPDAALSDATAFVSACARALRA